jgi:DNA-binding transcriptional ArsR family regulator
MKPTKPGADLGSLAQAFRALSNPNRLAMYLELLRFNETNVKSCPLAELINRLDIGAPTVSHHTKELVSAGLIEVERDGKFIRCRLNDAMRQKLAGFFQK